MEIISNSRWRTIVWRHLVEKVHIQYVSISIVSQIKTSKQIMSMYVDIGEFFVFTMTIE